MVPLRFAGITRLLGFDRSDTGGLVSRSYRLGAFVPMQGDGAFDDQLITINGEVGLRLDHPQTAQVDVPALRSAVHGPKIERWSGAAFDFPDEQELFLLTNTPEASVYMLYASENLVQQGAFTPTVLRGVPALIEAGSFAYRTKRANEQIGTDNSASTTNGGNRQTAGYESGVHAHGPDAEKVTEQYLALQRRWATNYRRRGAARIKYHPHTAGTGELSGWHTVKRHGTVSVAWT